MWVKVQKGWQYLQPIFYSDDIIRQMPTEGKKFSMVQKQFKVIMDATKMTPSVLESTGQQKYKEQFEQLLEQLDQITKGLNDYLNRKRADFARFYFLSNDELLSILA